MGNVLSMLGFSRQCATLRVDYFNNFSENISEAACRVEILSPSLTGVVTTVNTELLETSRYFLELFILTTQQTDPTWDITSSLNPISENGLKWLFVGQMKISQENLSGTAGNVLWLSINFQVIRQAKKCTHFYSANSYVFPWQCTLLSYNITIDQ